ncbi:MAG: hypothetical protein RMH77_01925 [Sulfolobales archaeon]|nr:hypothetical protein [Sulfolobales archaeon]MCX8185889.1 hypothetical protein [Sulfolobales archaeon]MDW7969146.1 hypothetical protein [Sulfolobales archaeon]
MASKLSSEELVVKFFSRLFEITRKGDGNEDSIKELTSMLEGVTESDESGFYSVIYLLLLNLPDDLLKLSDKDRIKYFLKSHKALVASFRKVLRIWVGNQREIIEYLENSGVADHPLANVFVISEILGLLDPLSPDTFVIRGNIYLNYLKILKEYEAKAGLPLKVQADRAFKNALELYSKAVSMDINCYEGYLGLARLYTLVNDLDQALTNYENALRCRRSCEVLKEVADIYILKGLNDVAYRYLEECKDDVK